MKILYLHIGMTKTGTTAIQLFMRKNEERLKSMGYLYPDFGLRYRGIGPNRNAHWLHRLGYKKTDADKCFEKLREWSGQYDNIVISDEGIWTQNIWRTEKWEEGFFSWLKARLDEIGISLKVIVYLRRQDEMFLSLWQQHIKENKSYTFQEFMEANRDHYYHTRMNYWDSLQVIEEAVGMENLTVRLYQKDRFRGKNPSIVSDFLDVLGIPDDDQWKHEKKQVNQSLSDAVLEMRRIMNGYEEMQDKRSHFYRHLMTIQDKLKEEGKVLGRPALTQKERMEILSPCLEGNRKVAVRYLGMEEGADLFFLPVPEAKEEALPPVGMDEVVDVCMRLIILLDGDIQTLTRQAADREKDLAALEKELENEKRSLKSRVYHRIKG